MKYQTKVTNIKDGKEYIHGHSLEDLMNNKNFTQTIFLLLKGKEPSESEQSMLDAMLVAAIDHGPGTASAQTARIAASAKSELHVSVAAGILAMGERHGSAIEPAANLFQEQVLQNKINKEDIEILVKEYKEAKRRIPGYGHPFLKEDHRSAQLFSIAKEQNIFGAHCDYAISLHKELNKQSSKQLPINIDGAMAAILSDMGFDWKVVKGFFLIARVPGLVAHVYEEMVNDVGIRRLSQNNIEYVGK